MVYTAPTLETLRTAIARDLHDSNYTAFSSVEITDLINMGIAELNRLTPMEYLDDVAFIASTYSYALDETVDDIFRVEMWRDGGYWGTVPRIGDESNTGWEFYGGTLLLPTSLSFDSDEDTLRLWGYSIRDPLLEEEDVAQINLEGEMVIRSYCQFTCFQRLVMSRALFQQWQTNANNTDVSPTQLLGMANVYASEWRALRNRVRRIRRPG